MDTRHGWLVPSREDVFLYRNKLLPEQTEQMPQVGKGFLVPLRGSCRAEQEARFDLGKIEHK